MSFEKTGDIVEIDFNLVHHRLRGTRESLGIDVQEAGTDTGIGPQYLGQLERIRNPGVWRHIVALASYYQTTTDWLLGAPWANNRERSVTSEWSEEALGAVRLMDKLEDRVSRQGVLEILDFSVERLAEMGNLQAENIRLRLLIEEILAIAPELSTGNGERVLEIISQFIGDERTK